MEGALDMDSDVLNMEVWTHSYIAPTGTYIPMYMWGLRGRNNLTVYDYINLNHISVTTYS